MVIQLFSFTTAYTLKNPLDLFGNEYHTGFLISYTEKIIANQTLSTLWLTFIVLFQEFYLFIASMVLERGSKFVVSKFIFTYSYSASSLEKRQFLLASLLYSIRITKRSAILFYFSISGNIQCYQFRCILSRAGNFYTSVQTEMKNTLTPPWKKFQIAIAIFHFSHSRPFC